MNQHVWFDLIITWLASHGLIIAVALLAAWAALRLTRGFVGRAFAGLASGRDGEMQKRVETLAVLVRYTATVAILAVTTLVVLGELGVDLAPLIAAAGVIGVAVGFGSRQLVEDVIGGFFLLVEDQVRVGDVIEVAGHAGLVEAVTLRTIRLRDLSGHVHFVRNGQITAVVNMTKDFSNYVFDVGVAYRENVDEVISILKSVDEDLRSDPEYRDDILEPLEVFGLDRFAESAVIVKARSKTLPIKQWRVGREFNRRLKQAFDQRGIEIPFPHVTVYAGQAKDGTSPPLPVLLREKP
jgi:small conductance mechanosensitive channel